MSKDAYICSTEGVNITTKIGGFKSILGGEGLFLTHLTADVEGDVWFGGYGFIERHELAAGQELVVDSAAMMAFTADIQHRASKVGGMKSFFLGGEGIVLRYIGPGVVYTQSRDLSALASLIMPFLPTKR